MEIRDADPLGDAAACVAIYAPFVTDSSVSFDEVPPTVEEFAEKIKKLSQTHAFLVALEDGQVIGFAYSSPYRERVAYRWSAEVSVYINGDYRGRGIGKALYDVLLDLMRRQGMRVAIAGITQPNPASMALHQSCGFVPVGVFERIGYKQGGWRDVAFLSLQLVSGESEDPPQEPSPAARL
jgi:L-amino acid N-acyltransferase YncA